MEAPRLLSGVPMAEYLRVPGIYENVTHEEYLAVPAFSRSLAHLLLSKTPRHVRAAWFGQLPDEPTEEKATGSLLHRLVLGTGQAIVVVAADSWRTNAAKAERDAALEAGALPVLEGVYEHAAEAASRIIENIKAAGYDLSEYQREVSMFWAAEPGIPARARLDLVRVAAGHILDLKFTKRPRAFPRTIVPGGLHIQRAAYVDALSSLRPELAGRVTFEFLAIEPVPLYEVAVVEVLPPLQELGQRAWWRACTRWKACQESGEYPGYGRLTADAKPWELTEDFETQLAETPEPDWIRD